METRLPENLRAFVVEQQKRIEREMAAELAKDAPDPGKIARLREFRRRMTM
jgi:muconolactone delta-isomerase